MMHVGRPVRSNPTPVVLLLDIPTLFCRLFDHLNRIDRMVFIISRNEEIIDLRVSLLHGRKWNDHDIKSVISLYAENLEFSSPKVGLLM
jgi:hypothetical protein